MHQPAIFWRKEITDSIGLLREDLDYILDFDYWVRLSQQAPFLSLGVPLAFSHYHSGAKTADHYTRFYRDLWRHRRRYWSTVPLSERLLLEVSALAHRPFWSLRQRLYRRRHRLIPE